MCKSNCVWKKRQCWSKGPFSPRSCKSWPWKIALISWSRSIFFLCTCVIPFVMLKYTVGGGRCWGWVEGFKVCCGAIRREVDFLHEGGFQCPIVCMHLVACGCVHVPTSIFNVCVFVFSLVERPGESYFSIFESWPSLFSIPWRHGAFVIQVAGIVTSGASVWEDGGQEYHVW